MKELVDYLGPKKRTIRVFLKNKLASADTSIAFLYPYSLKTKSKVVLYTTDIKTYNEIKKNHVLYDAIQEIGSIEFIWRLDRKLLSDLKQSLVFLRAITACFLPNNLVIHFNNTNSFPLNILNLISKKKVYYLDLFFICPSKNFIKLVNNFNRPSIINLYRVNAITFCKNRPIIGSRELVCLEDPYKNNLWMSYINSISDTWYEEIKKKFGDDKKIILYVLRTFGADPMMDNDQSNLFLFKETIRLLSKLNNVVILLKPHYITDMKIVNEEISKYPNIDIDITYAHPLVVSKYSSFFIANFYSLALHFAKLNKKPVLEYTDYSEETLDCTLGSPIGEDLVDNFFIKGQEDDLLNIAQQYISY
jgi:hypothetical protein